MTQYQKHHIIGVNPIVAMPFLPDRNIDYDGFTSILDHLAQTGCHGITLFGIASEFYKLTEQEKQQLTKIFLSTIDQSKQYRCISVTAHATEIAALQAKTYEKLGADALMLLPPFFLKPNKEQILEHITTVLSAVSIPVLIQYAPTETTLEIHEDTMAEIAKSHPHAVFKIECNPPVEYSRSLLKKIPDAVILNGYAGLYMMDMLDIGGSGVMPGCSFTEIYMKIYHQYQTQPEQAKQLHAKLLPFITSWMRHPEYIIAAEKEILQQRGVIQHNYCRKPAYELQPQDYDDIQKFLTMMDNIIF